MANLSAVLTGDLIGSTEADPDRIERTMTILAEQVAMIGAAIDHDPRFTRYRGDGWQIHLPHPRHFLWVTVYLNAVLRSEPKLFLPSRIAIGLGRTDRLGLTGLAGASGTAFVHSGRALDAMVVVGETIELKGEGTDDIQRCALAFIDDRISRWSQEQAQAVKLDLSPGSGTHADMAAILGISRQAVGARLQAAGGRPLMKALDAFFNHDWQNPDV